MHQQACAHAQRVISMLNRQRELGQFCDVVLSVGPGQVYPAHRNILACFSQLFQDASSNTTPNMEVHLPQECPSDGLKLLLDFFYTGELKLENVSWERVNDAASALSVSNTLIPAQPSPIMGTSETNLADFTMSEAKPESSMLNVDKADGVPVKGRSTYRQKARQKRDCAIGTTEAPVSITITTTRSGRRIKEPRRLVGQNSTEVASQIGPPRRQGTTSKEDINPEEGSAEAENKSRAQNANQPEVNVPILDGSDQNISNSKTEMDNDVEDDNFDGNAGVDALSDGTDEEYIPSSSPNIMAMSGQRPKRRYQGKPFDKEKGDDTTKESRKGSVQCPTCHKTFLSKYYLKVHNRRHTGEKPFKCESCGKCYYRKENLLEHQRRNCQSRTEVVFSCSVCSKIFHRRLELRVHMVSHTGEMPNKCTSCSEQFMQKKDLRIHLIKVHGAPKPHACSLCTKCFFSRTELHLHEASKHRGEKLFVCEECGHRASSRNGLQMHIKAIHRNERPFVCEFCSHAFTQKANLNMHLRTHTGEKPFQCHLCGKTFRTQASLDKHHRTHTGERPYACEFCEQRFTEKGPLLRHVASKHQEGRPHYCQICSKTFKAVEQLRVHVRRHKGMRKFECSQCGYKFTRQAHLRRHAQIHNRVENYNPRQRRLRNLIVEVIEDKEKTSATPPVKQGTAESQTDVIAGVTIQPGAIMVQEVVPVQGASEPSNGESQTGFPVLSTPGTSTGRGQAEFSVLPAQAASSNDGETEFTVVDVLEHNLLGTDTYPIQQTEADN
ncbi:zinc finger and BTB domain-containing protein 48 [Alosa pseudoharengus]|uniref:zinc finger and BTB domain-containing protein 48 n=1 Tax=Alosa pseudoharengus TaxID=34774 RepID=UPI003F89C878